MKIFSFVFVSFVLSMIAMHPSFADDIKTPIHPFNQATIKALMNLKKSSRERQAELLRTYPTLTQTPLLSTRPPYQPNATSIFAAQTPTISWTSENSRTDCACVTYANQSLRYHTARFKILREQAIELLDQKPINDKAYEDTINEITMLLALVKAAFPESFFFVDRKARYVLTPSVDLQQRLSSPETSMNGFMDVSAIKFGTDDWIPLATGLTGLANFTNAPVVILGQIILERMLTPNEACLQNLDLSLAGTMPITISRLILDELPPPRRLLPGNIVRRPRSR